MFSNAGFSVTPFASTAGQTINVALVNTAQCIDATSAAQTFATQVQDTLNIDSSTVTYTSFVTQLSEAINLSSTASGIVFYGLSVTDTVQTSSIEDAQLSNNVIVSNTANLGYVLELQTNLYPYVYEGVAAYDENTGSQVTNNVVSENSNGAASLDVSFVYNSLLSESSNGVDGVSCTTEKNGFFVDATSVSYATATTVDFACSVAETFELSDAYLSGGVFNPTVDNVVNASFGFIAGLNVENAVILEGTSGYSDFYGAYLWNPIDDNQTPVWTAITTPSGNWTIINDTNSPNWVNIETT